MYHANYDLFLHSLPFLHVLNKQQTYVFAGEIKRIVNAFEWHIVIMTKTNSVDVFKKELV
jgi:hypothetical protein